VEYFGLDVHKQYTVFTHVDKAGILLGQGRIDNDLDSLETMLRRAESKTKVVLEAGGIWPVFADALEKLGQKWSWPTRYGLAPSPPPGSRPIESTPPFSPTSSAPI
jgi:hypothetical protein